MNKLITIASAAAIAQVTAAAQLTIISTESFDYQAPAILQNQNGGTGWSTAWDLPLGGGNEIVIFDPSVTPVMTCRDMVGQYAGQATEFVAGARQPAQSGHTGVIDQGKFGADGSTIWISFRTVMYQQFGAGSFGALQLWDTDDMSNEQLLLGSPFGTTAFHWGWDDEGGMGLPPENDTSTDAAVCARLVFRIDHQPGDERVRMWVDPVADFPVFEAPNLDNLISDLRWDEVRINSGGSGTHFFWDDIVIARGEPATNVGTSYCGPAVANSTGMSAGIEARGSVTVADNDLTLAAFDLPINSFGFFLNSQMTAFVSNPGGSQGNLCLGGAIGRYVGPGQIQNAGQAGAFDLVLDLANTPTPTGFVSVQVGETWNFQTWYRDAVGGVATSNFTDGVTVDFQ